MILSVDPHWDRAIIEEADFTRRAKARFLVVCTDEADHTKAILEDDDIPQRLEPHPIWTDCLCSKRTVTSLAGDMDTYAVDVEYSSSFDVDPTIWNENPLDKGVIIDVTYERASRAVQDDIDGQPIVNSADVPISPPLEVDVELTVYTITKNYDPGAIAGFSSYLDKVNSDLFVIQGQTYDVGECKIRAITPKLKWDNGVLYYQATWLVVCNPLKWRPHVVLDMGFSELVEGPPYTFTNRTIRNASGPLPQPSMLNGYGLKKEFGEDTAYRAFALNHWLEFTGTVPTT